MEPTVLFVDDEIRILAAIRRMLRREKYRKLFATGAKEALDIIDAEPVHVLVTDLRMPEMDGLTLIKEVRRRRPEIVRIVLTAYAQAPNILAAINEGDIFRFLTKPWDSEEAFKQVIREALEHYGRNRKRGELDLRELYRLIDEYENRLRERDQHHDLLWHYLTSCLEPAFERLSQKRDSRYYEEFGAKLQEFKRLLKPE